MSKQAHTTTSAWPRVSSIEPGSEPANCTADASPAFMARSRTVQDRTLQELAPQDRPLQDRPP
jgi:hypothetical protein